MSDTEMIDAIEVNCAWLTFASDLEGTGQDWRCHVAARHFARPDIRERSEKVGFGSTVREAINEAFK